MQTIERDGFTARQATLDDAPGILRVIEAAFPAWPAVAIDVTPLQHLEWKMGLPGPTPGHHTVVTLDGEVVATKLRWVGPVVFRGMEYLGDSGADYAVDPALQGRGLGRLLSDFEITATRPRGVIGYDPPSNNAIVVDHLQDKDKIAHPLRTWARPLRAPSFVATHLRAGDPPALLRGLRAAVGRARFRDTSEGVTPIELDRFDDRVGALWRAARDSFDFARIRDAAYLNWRYADPRSGRGAILGVVEAGELLAYAVLRPRGRAANLVDLLVHPDRLEAGAVLLRDVVARSRADGARSIVLWLSPGHPYEPALVAAGFVASERTVYNQFFTPRGGDTPPILDQFIDPTLRTHITMGDFDFA